MSRQPRIAFRARGRVMWLLLLCFGFLRACREGRSLARAASPEIARRRSHELAISALRARAAPASNLAAAARRFGDRYPQRRPQLAIRALSVLLIAAIAYYLPWMFEHLHTAVPWLAWPFAAASVFSALCVTMSVINNWSSRVAGQTPLRGDDVPVVAVLIPTCGEPVPMILRTALGVLEQDYPADRMVVVVSDDAHNPSLAEALDNLGIIYHEPPPRDAPGRDGAAKAGNLNSALALVLARHPTIRYIETRDADDELGSDRFLRQTIGQLEADPRLAFVQTVKEAQVSAGDPFYNLDSQFYRGQMLCRHAANATFPCGSGLVWRVEALESIGWFPTWNLVEDLQSGMEALRCGWHGCYLPIVGAVGQHSPEDVKNIAKQRGTWAIDTVRLLIWGTQRGLTLRQRLFFTESAFFYLHSFTALVYIPGTALAFLGVLPLTSTPLACLLHLMPYALLTELRVLALNGPFGDRRKHQRRPLRAFWFLKLIWIGMAPIYIRACCKALLGGPNHKPAYKVTRKRNEVAWHWRQTIPEALLAAPVPIALAIGLIAQTVPSLLIVVPTGYWGLENCIALALFVARGWYGTSSPGRRLAASLAARRERRTSLRPLLATDH